MRATPGIAAVLLLITAAVTRAQGTSAPRAADLESWALVDAWPRGQRIILTLQTGERTRGAFTTSSAEELVLRDQSWTEHTIRKADVLQVISEKRDTIMDGLLLGAAIGAGVGVIRGYDGRTFECRAGCSIAIGVTASTLIGALVGWLRDRHEHQTEVLFSRPR